MLSLIRCCLWKLISTNYGVLGFYYLHNLRRIRKYLSQDCLVTLIHAFVISRLDYCNSLMYGPRRVKFQNYREYRTLLLALLLTFVNSAI